MWLGPLFMIYVFTGNGKGKTCAAIGIGVRAVGAGKKVLMIQFLKNGSSSEVKTIRKIDDFKIKSFGRKGFFIPEEKLKKHPELKQKGVESFSEQDAKLARQGLAAAEQAAQSQNYDLLILDEINLVLHFNLVEKSTALNFLKKHRERVDIILTGRHALKEIIEMADLVTEFKEVKHYYQRGVEAQPGIDF